MRSLFAFAVCFFIGSHVWADSFDRLNSADLQDAAEKGKAVEKLGPQAGARAKLLPRAESPCLIIKTSEGNWAKALVSWQFKKANDKPVPILFIERFVTFGNSGKDASVAVDKNVVLFGGFAYDFDMGQVVPAELGGDVLFSAKGEIEPLNGGTIILLDGSTITEEKGATRPEDRDGVLPGDFNGKWTLSSDGRWAGMLTLTVDEAGVAAGEFFTEETKSLYKVSGKVAPGQPHRIKLSIEFANTTQAYDAFLWTKDKSAMAGTMTMAGKTFGFYAVRVVDK